MSNSSIFSADESHHCTQKELFHLFATWYW